MKARWIWISCVAAVTGTGGWAPVPVSCAAQPPDTTMKPAGLFATYTDYQDGGAADMVPILLSHLKPDVGPLERLPLGIGAHGNTIDIWNANMVGWIDGTGTAATSKWAGNWQTGNRAKAYEGRKASLAMVQLNLCYDRDNREKDKQAKTEAAVAGYVAAAKRAGATLVFLVLPGGQHITHKGKKGTEPVRKEAADFAPELSALNAECVRLAKAHGAVLAPIPQAYGRLRQAHPEMDLHPPMGSTDGHASPQDAYLFACAVAFSLLDQEPKTWPAPGEVFASENRQIERLKKDKKRPPDYPLAVLTAEEQRAIHEAVWAAIAAFRKEAGNP